MRVVVLVNDPLLHDSRLFKECRSLRAAGHRVSVLGRQQTGQPLPRHFRKDGCDYYRPATYARSAILRRIGWRVWLTRLAVRQRPDVILNHRFTTLLAAIWASWATGARIVYDNRELFGGGDFDGRGAIYRQLFWMFERTLVRGCDEVIMSSHGRAETWARKYRYRKPRVLYDCTERREIRPSDALRREYGLGSKDKLLIYVGGIGLGRGLKPSLEALSRLPKDYHFVAMGAGSIHDGEILSHARQLGVTDRFFLHAAVPWEEIPSYLSGADLSLCLIEPISKSYYHSVPQKFYESLQAGVPVLASDFPEMRRLVTAHRVGRCAPPTDAPAIAKAILDLTNGSVPPEQWRRRCKKAADALTWENEVRELLRAVRQAGPRRCPGRS